MTGGSRGSSQAAVLVRLAEKHYRMLASDDGRPYAVKRSGPNVTLLLRAKGALRAQLARIYADEYKGRARLRQRSQTRSPCWKGGLRNRSASPCTCDLPGMRGASYSTRARPTVRAPWPT